jgi:phospholipid-binding lipoprotein MlaA
MAEGEPVANDVRRMPHAARRPAAWMAVLAVLVLGGCATAPHGNAGDPFEPTNRAIYGFNTTFNTTVTLPVAWVYVNYVPGHVRKGVRNALGNLESPVTFANDLLQGEFTGAGETLARFVLNSSIGLGGLVDYAAMHGLAAHQSDFGQTLARYGVGSGPFLVLPVIGPSTPRDILGTGVDLAADPLFYVPADWPLLAHAGVVVGTHTLAPFEQNAGSIVLRRNLGQGSLDRYATMRSVYRQQRAKEIWGGLPPMPDD